MKLLALRRPGARARRALRFVLAALAVLGTPALLFAHARLVRSSPASNAAVTGPVTAITLWYSERPELRFTLIQLFDSASKPRALGRVAVLDGDTMAVTAQLEGPLAAGRYTVAWRTAAADGHASSGRYRFVVVAAAESAQSVTAPTAPGTKSNEPSTSKSNPLVEPAPISPSSSTERWAELVAVLTLIGAVVFRLAVLPGARWTGELAVEAADRARRLAFGALVLFIIATLIRAIGEAALMPGAGSSRFASVVMLVQETRWGRGWAIGAGGALVTLVGLSVARGVTAGWLLAGLGAICICLGEGLTGHTGTSRHFSLAVATDLAHFLGAGGWLGGLTVVLLSGLPSLRRLGENEARSAGSRLARAYHGSALECVTLVLISAVIAAWLRLPTLSALWTTPYGQVLLWKAAFVVIVLLFGWYHWRSVVSPEWQSDTKRRFRRSGIAELLVGAVVVAITATLVSLPLPQ